MNPPREVVQGSARTHDDTAEREPAWSPAPRGLGASGKMLATLVSFVSREASLGPARFADDAIARRRKLDALMRFGSRGCWPRLDPGNGLGGLD